MNTRDRLMRLISDGIDVTEIGDNSKKSILIRGCDPEMGRRAIELLKGEFLWLLLFNFKNDIL